MLLVIPAFIFDTLVDWLILFLEKIVDGAVSENAPLIYSFINLLNIKRLEIKIFLDKGCAWQNANYNIISVAIAVL